MKCIKCGNEINENVSVCPVCNNPINVIPQTPDSLTLPQDQGIELVKPEEEAIPANLIKEENKVPSSEENMIVQPTVAALNNFGPAEAPMPKETAPEMSSSVAPTPEVQPQPMTQDEIPVAPQPAAPLPTAQEQIEESGKLGSYEKAPVIDPAKKKKNFKVIIIIAICLALIGGLGFYGYYLEFQTSGERIANTFSKVFSPYVKKQNSEYEKSSGEYALDAKIGFNTSEFKTNITGKYAFDIDNKIIDVTTNINNLKLDEELLVTPLSFETYYYDNTIYFLLQNFIDKFIYSNVEEIPTAYYTVISNLSKEDQSMYKAMLEMIDFGSLKKTIENVGQNDIDYQAMTITLKRAITRAFSSLATEQKVAKNDLTQDGGYVNIVTVNFNKKKNNIFIKNVLDTITKDDKFVDNLSKILGITKEQCLALLKYDDSSELDLNMKVDIYTSLFKKEFLGMKIKSDKTVIKILPVGANGYKITIKDNNVDVLSIEYSKNIIPSATTKEVTDSLKITYYFEKVAYNFELTFKNTKDVTPNVQKVNVKNSVKYNNLGIADYLALEKIRDFGKLGLLLKDKIDYDENKAYCKAAINCEPNPDGTKTCNYCTYKVVNGVNQPDCTKTITCN